MSDTQEKITILESALQRVQMKEDTERECEEVQQEIDKVQEKIRRLQKEKEFKSSVSEYLRDFMGDISERANTPPISTGFEKLDRALGGGLFEGLYALGAVTSAGKSALVMQIADQIAQQGRDVIVIALEMSRFELMARSISRHTYIRARENRGRIEWAKTARGITDGSRHQYYNQQEKTLIAAAMSDYSEYADHLYIFEGVGNIGVGDIRKLAEERVRDSENGEKPIIIIDYLQILAPADVRASDKQNTDKAILELKRLSRDLKLPVIVISSLNRESYKKGSEHKGEVTLDSFKESGAVEYSCDCLLGWQFQSAGKEFDFEEEYKRDTRKMQIVILKNRQGARGTKIDYNYIPMFNYSEEKPSESEQKRKAI